MNILIVHGTQRSFYRHPCGGNRYRSYDKACRSPMSLFHVKEIAGLLLSLIEILGSHVADLDQFRQIEVPLKRGMLQGLPISPSGEQRQVATESVKSFTRIFTVVFAFVVICSFTYSSFGISLNGKLANCKGVLTNLECGGINSTPFGKLTSPEKEPSE